MTGRTHENDHHSTRPHPSAFALTIDPEALRPLIQAVVAEAVAQIGQAQAAVPDKLCFSEPEAARLLGLNEHQLRDERLRGRIQASAIVGRRIRYTRENLVSYLAERRWEAKP